MEKKRMQHFMPMHGVFRRSLLRVTVASGVLPLILLVGCGGGSTSSSSTSKSKQPQTYLAPYVVGTTNGSGSLLGQLTQTEIYAIDDTANAFSQSIFGLVSSVQGPQAINVGNVTTGQRGLLDLGITANYAPSGGIYVATDYSPAKSGSFALELAGQTGGLVQIVGQPVAPLVAASECPSLSKAETWQFITIPGGLIQSANSGAPGVWYPATDTAYGSVDISSSGSTITFNNIKQYTLPSVGGTGSPAVPATSPATGICGSTTSGYTIGVPGQAVIQDPGLGSATQPSATIGIGSTGLLVEDNGVISTGTSAGQYKDVLGAGTGAVGLPKPSSAVDVSAVRSTQYLGFVRGAGIYSPSSVGATGWSSHLASFGFSTAPSSCASVATSTSTLLYGGDFTNDDPSTSSNGFGNCDLAIDLGTQDSTNNGLFPNATVWLGTSYAANTTGKTYSFPAVAIAGQLNGKYAIFLIGVDSTEPWTIYLLQSN